MLEDVLSMGWLRLVYFDPTSSPKQVAAAWRCAELTVAPELRHYTYVHFYGAD